MQSLGFISALLGNGLGRAGVVVLGEESWEGKVNNLSFVPVKGMGFLSQVCCLQRQQNEIPPPHAGGPHISQPGLLTSEDSAGFPSFFQPTQEVDCCWYL